MALGYFKSKLSILPRLFQPLYDAIFSTLPIRYRWRLLVLQPINTLIALITSPTWLFSNRYSVLYIPTRFYKHRALVYQPPKKFYNPTPNARRPLHIDIHGGGFIGGFAEQGARWCAYLSDQTGAVVVSCTYRVAPRYTFPAAHNDIDDVVSWILEHAETVLDADPKLLTIGGSSVGASLALSAAIKLHRLAAQKKPGQGIEAKAVLSFTAPVDYRLKPEQKPRPPNFPKKDPLFWLVPMYDTYAGPARAENLSNPRLNPIIADRKELPRDMLFIIAGIDILLHEQLSFVERIRSEYERSGEDGWQVEAKVFDKGFHGWLECAYPS
jgi:acetyl esterase/lipase